MHAVNGRARLERFLATLLIVDVSGCTDKFYDGLSFCIAQGDRLLEVPTVAPVPGPQGPGFQRKVPA